MQEIERRFQTRQLSGADLSRTDLSQTDLSRTDLFEANLSEANLTQADLRQARLTLANLTGANLTLANLVNTDLIKANLTRANLTRADLRDANLHQTDLTLANLTHAILIEANVTQANLTRADLTRADLFQANLAGAIVKGTCLDPDNEPNQDIEGFEHCGEFVVAYRTREARHIDKYRDGRTYSADVFSTADTECHPGLYICPTVTQVKEFAVDQEIIRVHVRPRDVHRAGSKWRCREFFVVGKEET